MISFNKIEILHLIIVAVVLTLAFGETNTFLISFTIVLIILFLHELVGHKLTAKHYGAETEFRIWPLTTILALLTSIFGIIFAYPGGSQVISKKNKKPSSKLTAKEIAIIALAGPATNIILGLILLAAHDYLVGIFTYAAKVSFLLGVVSLLPVGPLDGAKIARWSWVVWFMSAIVAVSIYLLVR